MNQRVVLMENSGGLNQLDYKLELIKNKGIHEQSAIASFEVKKRLQEFVLQKKKREAATANSSGSSTGSSTASSSQDYSNVPNINAIIGQELNPLRKTASEPNIKVRSALKAKVFERRASPLLKRKLTKRSRTGITLPVSGLVYASNPTLPISGPNQGVSSLQHQLHGIHPDVLLAQAAAVGGQHGSLLQSLHHQLLQQHHHQLVDLSPPSSPTSISMQMRLLEQQGNLSPTPPSHVSPYSSGSYGQHPRTASAAGSSAEPIRVHNPLLHLHQLQSSLPPSTETYSGQDSPSSLMMVTNQSEGTGSHENRLSGQESSSISSHHHQLHTHPRQPPPAGQPLISQQVARCKPLVRTLSSPLPLGQGSGAGSSHVSSGYSSPCDGVVNLSINSNSNLASTSNPQQLNQRKYLLQHIRQTVLTRASSKQQLQRQSFEEETEAAVEQEMKDVDVSEINSATPSTSSSLFTCSVHPSTHLTPKAKFKRQFQQQDNVHSSTVPGQAPTAATGLSKQPSFDLQEMRDNEYLQRSLQASLWAHNAHALGQLQKPPSSISRLVYASNPSLPITGHHGHGQHHHHPSYHQQMLQHHHQQMSEPSPPSSPTSVSMQMRVLEQGGQSSPPSVGGVSHQHTQHLIHHPTPQRAHHPLLHFHQLQSSLPTYNYNQDSSPPPPTVSSSSAMVTNQSEEDERREQQLQMSISSQDPSQLLPFSCSPSSCTTTNPEKRSSIKPLIRTLSSPLPLGRGLSASSSSTCNYEPGSSSPFEGGALNLTINNNTINSNYNYDTISSKQGPESSFSSNILSSQQLQQDRKFLLQHIRQTVITRVSSKQKLAAEAAAAAASEATCQDEVQSSHGNKGVDQESGGGQEKMEEEEGGEKGEEEEDVDVENLPSTSPSKSSPSFSNQQQQQSSSTHLTPKAKFLRQFLQDNISSLPGGNSGQSVGYSPPTSCVPVTTSTSSDQHQ